MMETTGASVKIRKPKKKKGVGSGGGISPPLTPVGFHVGILQGDSVVVTDEESIKVLSSMGSFGQHTGQSTSSRIPHVFRSRREHLVRRSLSGPPSPPVDIDQNETSEPSASTSNAEVPQSSSSDSETEEMLAESSAKRFKQSTTTESVAPSTPSLSLTLCEAFYLAFAIGCLKINHSDDEGYTLEKFWNFVREKEGFLSSFAVYQYYRNGGWVVKGGLNYGCDFVLYKDGPAYYHSNFGVRVIPPSQLGQQPLVATNWSLLSGLTRAVSHVNKDLILAYVILDEDFNSQQDLIDPSCVSKFCIKEMLVQPWFPGKDRIEQQRLTEISSAEVNRKS